MIGSMEEYKSFDKRRIFLCILAGVAAGLSSMIKEMNWLHIIGLTGAGIFGFLLVYKYHWVGILNILLLSVVVFEPAPSDILFVFLFTFGIIGDHLDFGRLKDSRIMLLLPILYAIIGTLQLFFIRDIAVGIRYYIITLYLMAFCAYIFMYVSQDNIKSILRAYIISSTLSAILGIFGYAGFFPSILMYDQYRIMAFFKDPNVLGPFLVPSILMLMDDIRKKQLIHHYSWVHITLIIINILGIIATFSRGAWVNLIVCISVYLAFNIKNIRFKRLNFKKILIYVVPIVIAISLIWGLTVSDEYKHFFYGRVNLQSYDKDRFAVQGEGVMLAFINILGYGPGQFEYNVIRQTGVIFSAHNLYIRLLVENGVIGFIAFIGSLALIFYKLVLDFKQGETYIMLTPICLIAILSGIMVNSIVIDTLHWRHFWFFIGLSMANFTLKVGEGSGNKGI